MNDGGVEFPSSETESEDDLDSVSVVARTRDRLSGTGSTQSEDSSTHSGESSIHSHSTVSQDSGISETEDSRTRTKPSRPIRKIEPTKRKNCSLNFNPVFFFAPSFLFFINCFLLLEQSQSMSSGWVFKNLFKFALKIMKSKVPYSCLIFSVAKLKF